LMSSHHALTKTVLASLEKSVFRNFGGAWSLQLVRAFSSYPYLRIKSELYARTSAMGLLGLEGVVSFNRSSFGNG
jgi:hypothetical protein